MVLVFIISVMAIVAYHVTTANLEQARKKEVKMIKAVNENGALIKEVNDITGRWLMMKKGGWLDNEDYALLLEKRVAKEILYEIRSWVIKRRGPEINDKTLKEFVGILLGQKL